VDINNLISRIEEEIVIWMPKFFMAIIIFAAFWIAGAIIDKVIGKILGRSRLDHHISGILGRVAKIALVSLGFVSALGTMGVNVSALVASLGLTGFALGFALRDALSNFLAGILILFYRPFHI
jgi:small-conductance mechanosensitive channel